MPLSLAYIKVELQDANDTLNYVEERLQRPDVSSAMRLFLEEQKEYLILRRKKLEWNKHLLLLKQGTL